MKKMLFTILVSLLAAQLACTQAVRYTEEEIRNYPQNIQDHIRKGEINLGMSKEQVRYAWGSPDSIKFLESFEEKTREEWIYTQMGTLGVIGTKLLFFYDGKLLYIK